MKKFNMSVLAIAIAASASSQAAMTFVYGLSNASYNEPAYNGFISGESGSSFTYKLRATTTSDRKLAKQGEGIGLGVGLPAGVNPWSITSGETINFELQDASGNPVDFTLTSIKTGYSNASFKLGYDERVTVGIAGNSYLVGGNGSSAANNSVITDANAMGSNPLYPNNRGNQFGWGDANASDSTADVASTFSLTGEDAVNGQTTLYRIQSVTLELAPATAVPVPAAAWLFGSALMGLTLVRRRK